MVIADGRYERLRHLVTAELARAQQCMELAAKLGCPASFEVAQDDADEWEMLARELDAAVPEALRMEVAGA